MATIKLGNFITEARGKINGNVYSKNKGGAYARVRVKPSNPRSTFQSAVRALFTTNSQAWRGLTAQQRQSWIMGVGNFIRKNRVADAITLSGNSLYQSLNKNLSDVGLPPIALAPAPADVETISIVSAVADFSAQTLIITMSAVVPANTSIKVFVSPTVSAGVNSIGSKLRQLTFANSGDAAILTLTADYLARFGSIGAAGSKIFYQIVPVNETTGQVGAAIAGTITIQA